MRRFLLPAIAVALAALTASAQVVGPPIVNKITLAIWGVVYAYPNGVTGDGYTSKNAAMSSGGTALTDSGRTCVGSDAGKTAIVAGGGTLAAIGAPTAAPTAQQFTAGTLGGTNEYYKITYVSSLNGTSQETTASAETTIAATANKVRYVNAPPPISGAIGWNIYAVNTAGGGSGSELKQNTTFTLAQSGSPSGTVLTFSAVPAWIMPGMAVGDSTTPSHMPPGTVVISTTGTTVTLSQTPTSVTTENITFAFINASGQTWLPFHRPWIEPTGGLASNTTGGSSITPPGSDTTSYAPPLVTTVASCGGTHIWNLNAANGSGGALSGDQWAFGTDASAALASLVAAYPNANIVLPRGLIVLNATTIPMLNNNMLQGQGVGNLISAATQMSAGTEFVLTSPEVVPFEFQNGARISGVNFLWPGQWRLYPGMVAYPPLFTDDGAGDNINNLRWDHNLTIDAFDLYQQSPAHFVASISVATTLVVSSILDGTMCVGGAVNGSSVTAGTTISSLPDGRTAGCTNAIGSYGIAGNSGTPSSEAMTSGTPSWQGSEWTDSGAYCIDVCFEMQFVGQAMTLSDTDFNENFYAFCCSDTNKYINKWSALNSAFYIALGGGTPNGAKATNSSGQFRAANVAFHSFSVVFDVLGGWMDEVNVQGGSAGGVGQYLITDPAGSVHNTTFQQNIQANQIVNNYDDNLGPVVDYKGTTTNTAGMQFNDRLISSDSGTLFKLNSTNMANFAVTGETLYPCQALISSPNTLSTGVTTACTQSDMFYQNDTSTDLIAANLNTLTGNAGSSNYLNGFNIINVNQGSIAGIQFNGEYNAVTCANFAAASTPIQFGGNTTQSTGASTPINYGTAGRSCLIASTDGNVFDKQQYVLGQVTTPYQVSIPMIALGSGTMSNNGAFVDTTALDSTYSKAFCLIPASGIATGTPAASTWYYCQGSTSSAFTICNNVYTPGSPAIPAFPASCTAFSTTGPGAITGVSGATTAIQFSVPGNSVGPNGRLQVTSQASGTNAAGSKSVTINYSTFGLGATSFTTSTTSGGCGGFANENATNVQVLTTGTSGCQSTSTTSTLFGAIDTTSAQNVTVKLTNSTPATNNIVLQSVIEQVMN